MNKYLVFIIISICLISCRKNTECDPGKVCDTIKPDSFYVYVNVSYAAGLNPVYLTLFKGDVEDNSVVLFDTFYAESKTYFLPTGERYSAKAIYNKNGNTYNAFDGGKLKVTHFWNCDEKCYEGQSLTLDLTLLQ